MMGFKDTDTGYDGKKLLKKYIELTILLKMIFGKSSRLYNNLYEQGLITPSFNAEYTMQPDYGYTAIEGESSDPKKVYELMLNEIKRLQNDGLNEKDFNRIKKVVWGEYIKTLNDVENYGVAFMQMLFQGIDYFDYYDVYKTVTFEDIVNRFNQHFTAENAALSVVNPIG